MERKNWGKVTENQKMSEVTTFQIGGPADLFVEPENIEELKNALEDLAKADIPWMVMGMGSNMLVSDGGIRGAVLRLTGDFQKISMEGNILRAGAMASLKDVALATASASLTGLEFAHGIPGSVGGAMTMNAGAYDGEMKDVVLDVTVLDSKGSIHVYTKEEMDFGYRHSRVYPEHLIVLEARFLLSSGDSEKIQEKIEDLWARRSAKQPLEMPSAGSTFKRPEGYYAGHLIDTSGLRGFRHRGAQVSKKHCGFVVNTGGATCQDVVELIRLVQEIVYEKHGVHLEPEVKVIGD